jgi:hypothetical protein
MTKTSFGIKSLISIIFGLGLFIIGIYFTNNYDTITDNLFSGISINDKPCILEINNNTRLLCDLTCINNTNINILIRDNTCYIYRHDNKTNLIVGIITIVLGATILIVSTVIIVTELFCVVKTYDI